jgi:hypothetical protein
MLSHPAPLPCMVRQGCETGLVLLRAGGRPAPLRVHHLTRVPVPAPTRAHPLAGLWRADFGGPAGQGDGGGGGGEPSIGVQVAPMQCMAELVLASSEVGAERLVAG